MLNKVYIGDNLEVMNSNSFKEYLGKIKFIYIDPPYNTLTQKSYNDKNSSEEWKAFMQPRLEYAKKILSSDGTIFISIDDNEYANLKILCDSVFEKKNFVGTFITKQSQRSNAKYINVIHEYILCYAKNKQNLKPFCVNRLDIPEDRAMILSLQREILKEYKTNGKHSAEKKLKECIKKICFENNITWLKNYSNIDDNGEIFFAVDLSTPGEPRTVDIPEISLHLAPLKTRGWAADKRLIELHHQNRLTLKAGRPYCKLYLKEATENCPSILNFFSRQGTRELKKLGLDKLFDTPKPVDLIKFLIRISTEKDDIILDFFAGSGTTAQAVYELNEEEQRNNRYILIQIAEKLNPNSICYQTCLKLHVIPNMRDILLHRINTFLKSANKFVDYDLIE